MADTVVSMARSMLGGAVKMAASAAAAEMGLLKGVRKDIWFIKDELETMQAFLEVAESMKKNDVLLKVWAKQIRDLSYNIEDCLAEFIVHVGSQNLLQRLIKLKDRHRIAIQIRDLKSRVEEVSTRNTRYNLIKAEASTSTIEEVDSYMEDIRNHSASNIDEADLVGFSKPKEELISLMNIKNEEGPVKVICVVGTGGLGKTTLARKIYESKEGIMENFSCFAWITVSRSFFKIAMLKDMIRQLLGDESLKACLKDLEDNTVQVEKLAQHLTTKLKNKRYFIIFDDLWTIDAWKWITGIVVPSDNTKGSHIIVTTRDVSLAKECTSDSVLIYYLRYLEIDDATDLLLRKSRKTKEDMKQNQIMKAVVEKIVKKCGGLPLAILTIGGMLATKKVTEWESIYMQIPSELEIKNPTVEALRRIVTLSYSQLPSHLKSCFLYLSIYPEDFEIGRRRLVERWIAEGFVRARAGVNIVDVGIGYFNELINRSMIQASKVNIEGVVKSCRVHDIMRDVMVSIARDESFVYPMEDTSITSILEDNFRHVAYHGSKCREIGMDWSHIRSLTVFGKRPLMLSHSLCSSDLRMLRALDVQDAQFRCTQKDIKNIGLLRHLKYLNVFYGKGYSEFCSVKGYSKIYKLPRSIGKLQGLQVLDLRGSYITTLPSEISELQGLRTLRCSKQTIYYTFDIEDKLCRRYMFVTLMKLFTPLFDPDERAKIIAELHMALSSRWSKTEGVRVPREIGNLKQLQILDVVDIKRTSSKAVAELGELTQLRKLGVVTKGASPQKCKIFCAAIEKLSSLRSLTVNANDWTINARTPEWLHSISSPPLLLRSLHLHGVIREMPDWIGSLIHLVKISLRRSRLEEGGKTMETLGALPNLMLLEFGLEAYVGEKLVFGAGAFPNLRKLGIKGRLYRLREVRFKEGTLPQMETIQISYGELKTGIIGIKYLSKLKEISLGYSARVANLGMLQRKVAAHPKHPVLRLEKEWSEHDLGRHARRRPRPTGSDVQVEIAAKSSDVQQALPTTMSNSNEDDDLLYTYNSC